MCCRSTASTGGGFTGANANWRTIPMRPRWTRSVTREYFAVMRIPVRRGRVFGVQDGPKDVRVAVIGESCARLQFPGEYPIGKQIQLGGRSESKAWITIVGVVGDV